MSKLHQLAKEQKKKKNSTRDGRKVTSIEGCRMRGRFREEDISTSKKGKRKACPQQSSKSGFYIFYYVSSSNDIILQKISRGSLPIVRVRFNLTNKHEGEKKKFMQRLGQKRPLCVHHPTAVASRRAVSSLQKNGNRIGQS